MNNLEVVSEVYEMFVVFCIFFVVFGSFLKRKDVDWFNLMCVGGCLWSCFIVIDVVNW